jgi:DNA-binding NtrC family response regulator
MTRAVLIVEDEACLAANVRTYLLRQGYEAEIAGSAEQALAMLDSFRPDTVLLDVRLPGMDGLSALKALRAVDSKLTVILTTGHGSVETAVQAMKAGAYDFLMKPVSLGKLKLLLEKATGEERQAETLSYLQRRAAPQAALENLLGDSEPMRELKRRMQQLLESERQLRDGALPAVLITGETGAGKELVARALHFSGPRGARPFVEINCAAIPTQLLESELFGHERGAFTDARERKLGLVETAEGGTLFLDEIGDMDPGLQAKLLKLLEEKTLRRIGSVRDQKADVRIIAATHQPVEALAREGRFRRDLYFRLRIVTLAVPPLRSRGDDIALLAEHFLGLHCARYNKKGLRFSPRALRALRAHGWPGNVRELRNIIEEAVLLTPAGAGLVDELNLAPAASPVLPLAIEAPAEGSLLANAERDLLRQALDSTGWNVTQAARLLGVSRYTLRYRIEKFQLDQL